MSTNAATNSFRFQSRHRNFCLYLDSPARRVEPDRRETFTGGVRCQFMNGRFATSDASLAARLRQHRAHGTTFHEIDVDAAKRADAATQEAARREADEKAKREAAEAEAERERRMKFEEAKRLEREEAARKREPDAKKGGGEAQDKK